MAQAQPGSGERTVNLPGDVRAFWQTTLFAKVSGYVRELRVDKGGRVRKGDIVARIASPETDHQVGQARATLLVRRRLALRVRTLAPKGFVSQQDLDNANADLAVAEADYRRVRALQDYEVLRAPFDGVVTARYVDPGALVTGSPGQPVVDLADPERARVQVYLGQDVAPFVQVGDAGEITADQLPGLRIRATVRRVADALDPRTRTMLVELWPEGSASPRLVPGLFVHVALRLRVPTLPSVPAEALAARGDRLQVALVRDGKLHVVDVEPGQNDGKTLQIRRGLEGGETVALSPPSDLGDGAPVRPLTNEKARAPGGPRQARTPPRGGEQARDGGGRAEAAAE